MRKLLSIVAGIGVVVLGAQVRAQPNPPTPPDKPPTPSDNPPTPSQNPPTPQSPPTPFDNPSTPSETPTAPPSPTPSEIPPAPYQQPPISPDKPPATLQNSITYEEKNPESDAYSYAWRESRLGSEIGVGVSLGGGVAGFTDPAMREVVKNDVGGLWDLRVSIGTHIPIGLDVSYLGTAAPLRTLGGSDNGTLIGTTAEGAVRYNILPHFAWDPYVFAGMGWQRYDVANAKFATSDTGVREMDNVLEFPMGAGIAFRGPSGFVVDMRGTFRAATDSDLLRQPNGDQAQLHTWEASGAIGYEF